MKHSVLKYLAIMMAILLLCMLVACGGEEPTTGTTTGTTTGATAGTTTGTTTGTTAGGGEPEKIGDIRINVINGTADGEASNLYFANDVATLTASYPANGYRFSHWEDEDGNVIGNQKTVEVTVTREKTYKAYYEVFFGSSGEIILENVAEGWRQGAFSGALDAWTSGNADLTRVSFKTPMLLKAGETLAITLPETVCCLEPGKCPKLGGEGDCSLRAAFMTLKKTGKQTGDVTQDYAIVSGSWAESMTATTDTYVSIMIKWDQHGSAELLLSNEYMQEVRVIHSTPVAGEGKPLGAHWNTELADTVDKALANREAANGKLSEFFYMTDVHWLHNAQYSPALINYLSDKLGVEHVVFGGDVIEYHNTNKQDAINLEINAFYRALEAYTKTGERIKVFSTIGNHDRNRADAENKPYLHIDEKTVYDVYLKRVEQFGVTAFGNANQSYYDDEVNKVRYIQFYLIDNKYNVATNAYTEPALDWAEERIMELDEDWTVVLFSHGYWRYNSTNKSLDLFEKNVEYKERILGIKKAARADIACWIVGHAHVDHTEVLTSETYDETLRIIAFNSDSYQNSRDHSFNGDDGVRMKLGTETEQSFNLIQIDPLTKKIYVIRVGAGEDAVYDYGEEKKIG